MTAPRLYTPAEAAAHVGGAITESYLRRGATARAIPHRRIAGRVCFTDEDLAEIVAAAATPPVPLRAVGRRTG